MLDTAPIQARHTRETTTPLHLATRDELIRRLQEAHTDRATLLAELVRIHLPYPAPLKWPA